MRKMIHKVHLWLSIPVGIIIAITCFSGAMLVFEKEIMEICHPNRYYVEEVVGQPLPIDQLMVAASQQLADTLSVSSIEVNADKEKCYRLGLGGRSRTAIYINPYTGVVKEVYTPGDDFFSTMRKLHRWLLDDYKRDGSISVGKMIVGISTLLFVFILLTGIIIWIPRSLKGLKRSLQINCKQGWNRFFREWHVAGGIYVALILLVLALTGLTWSFEWYRTGFYKVFGVEMQQTAAPTSRLQEDKANKNSRNHPAQSNRSTNGGGRGREREQGKVMQKTRLNPDENDQKSIEFSNWPLVFNQLAAQTPSFETITIQDGKASVTSSQWIGNRRGSDNYSFDASTGAITEAKLYKDQEKAGKIRGWIYSAHVGSWGGMLTKIITFLAALLGATLPLTGYYLWIKKYINRRKSRKK